MSPHSQFNTGQYRHFDEFGKVWAASPIPHPPNPATQHQTRGQAAWHFIYRVGGAARGQCQVLGTGLTPSAVPPCVFWPRALRFPGSRVSKCLHTSLGGKFGQHSGSLIFGSCTKGRRCDDMRDLVRSDAFPG
jgi:hypothetical protein